MDEQLSLQHILRKKFAELKARNPNISVRAFAKRLGLQASATNEILKGERRVSRKMAERIASRLALDPTERNNIFKHFSDRKISRRTQPADEDILKLNADQFEVVSGWVHFAILSLVKVTDFSPSIPWIAERLGVTEKQARQAVERLVRVGLLKRPTETTLARSHQRFHTSDDVLSPAIQKSHLEDMDLARLSLMRDPVELRDFSSMTMAVSPDLIPKAKELIRKAQDDLLELMESKPTKDVYRMAVYFFPLTQLSRKEMKA